MTKRTIILATIVTMMVSGTGAFAATRYIKSSLGLNTSPMNMAARTVASPDMTRWSQP